MSVNIALPSQDPIGRRCEILVNEALDLDMRAATLPSAPESAGLIGAVLAALPIQVYSVRS
jgi:hypothetical protein